MLNVLMGERMTNSKRVLKVMASKMGDDKCANCGVSIQPTLASKIREKDGKYYCSWWCKGEDERESGE